MKKMFRQSYWLGFIIVFVISCTPTPQQNSQITVAISKATPAEKYTSYIQWLKHADSTVTWVDLYSLGIEDAIEKLESCDGLLLTGGEDIYPPLYGKDYDTLLCDTPDRYRDSLEYRITQKAMAINMPVMGICRGMQMMNVALGGTLHLDLPATIGEETGHREPEYIPVHHKVTLFRNTLLSEITGADSGLVYSNHHQGVDRLAERLVDVAFSPDCLMEAVQFADTAGRSFFLGVQWHPEKMDFAQPLSGKIAEGFVTGVKKYARKNNVQ